MPTLSLRPSLARSLRAGVWFVLPLLGALLTACGGGADAPPPPDLAPVPPTIVQQPGSLTVVVGAPATFTAAATGTAPLVWQWQRDGQDIAGATQPTFAIAATVAGDSGAAFHVVVTNVAGSATSADATLTVTVPTSPPVLTITQQPVGTSVTVGSSASFTVGATCSAGTLDIRWQRNSGSGGAFVDIAGAAAATYTLATAASDTGAQFRAALDCSGDVPATSDVATLTVTTTVPTSVSLAAFPLAGLRDQAEIGGSVAIDQLADGSFVFTTGNWVRRVSADLSSITPLAGSRANGGADGLGAAAAFNGPRGLTHDAAGNVYVADTANSTIRRITPDGHVTTIAGLAGTSGDADGSGAAARFVSPTAIALGADGDLYVADDGDARIRRVTTAGVVTTYAGSTAGYAEGAALAARFASPSAVAVAANGDVLVADTGNHRVRRIVRAGNAAGAVETLAGSGSNDPASPDGTGTAAVIVGPLGLALRGNALAVRDGVGLLRQVDLASTVVTTITGSRTLGDGFADGAPAAARLRSSSRGVTTAAAGGWMLCDDLALRSVSGAGDVRSFAVAGALPSSDSATGVLAQMPFALAVNRFQSVSVDAGGQVVIADQSARMVRRISPAGVVSLAAGLYNSFEGMVDGQGSAAQFSAVGASLAADATGGLVVTDDQAIRRIAADGTTTLLAGARDVFPDDGLPKAGAVDGPGAVARFNSPSGLAVGPDGATYVADAGNSAIRRIDAAGNVTTWAGALGVPGMADGPRTSARFFSPGKLAFAPDGTLWVNDNARLRRVGADGNVTTVAGVGPVGALAVDAAGNLFYGSGSGLYELVGGAGSPKLLIAGAPNDAIVLGTAPHLGSIFGLAVRTTGHVVVLSGSQILEATIP